MESTEHLRFVTWYIDSEGRLQYHKEDPSE
jgi:hypothetical protein